MPQAIEQALAAAAGDSSLIGQVLVRDTPDGFMLLHRDDREKDDLREYRQPEDAIEIARWDDDGNYRPLKTAPNLRHGWKLKLAARGTLSETLDYFYPGRLSVFEAWRHDRLVTTPLRETLERQSGMYRVAASISDVQIDELAGSFCRSNGGCLRTILWKRDQSGAAPSTKLPPEKFDPSLDQAGGQGLPSAATTIPLLCQEACNLLVAECRKVVRNEVASRSGGFPAAD